MEPPNDFDILNLIKNHQINYGFVSNDAGGASELVSFINNEIKSKPSFSLVTGPALEIVKNSKISSGVSITKNLLQQSLENSDLLVTSTGWMTNLEKDAVSLANSLRLPTLSVIDHWINYRDRFGPMISDLPNHIAVNNSVAFDLCKQTFPNTNISIFKDYQLAYYKQYLVNRQPLNDKCILVVLDAVTNASFIKLKPILQKLIKLMEKFSKNMDLELVFRLHPAQKLINSVDFISLLNNSRIQEFSDNPLEQDLHRAEIVVGIDSKVLYYSSELNLPTFYAPYNSGRSWHKFFPRIKKLEVLL